MARLHHISALAYVFFLVATIGIAVRPVEAQKISPVPCLDPLGCPDLIVDGGPAGLGQWVIVKETYSATDCAVVEGTTQPGDRRLLRFTYTTPNLGPGDLIIGNPADHPEWFEFAICHDHLHFLEYADYRLWTTKGYEEWQALRADNPGALSADLLRKVRNLDQKMVAGAKLGFCVIDIIPATSSPDYVGPPPGPGKYFSCGSNQGISVGWADSYFFVDLDGQWFDITDVSPGDYMMEAEVNPERLFTEASYSNNAAAVEVTIPDRTGKTS